MGKSLVEVPHRPRDAKIIGHGIDEASGITASMGCQRLTAPLCVCCTPSDSKTFTSALEHQKGAATGKRLSVPSNDIKDLVVVGAGPHALALALRLLEPEADLLSDKERHLCADYVQRMRPLSRVRKHIQDLSQGPKVVLKKRGSKKKNRKGKTGNKYAMNHMSDDPPHISLDFFRKHCAVIDSNGSKGWMAGWKDNFAALQIEHLRSPISAHCDPYDHRGLEFYAEMKNRSNELVGLDHMPKSNSRWDFHGPFNAPSTSLFNDFHDQLAESYGISDMVKEGNVVDVQLQAPSTDKKEPIFHLSVKDVTGAVSILRTRRLVCALGPATPQNLARQALSWEPSLRTRMEEMNVRYCNCVLHGHEILDWLSKETNVATQNKVQNKRILIVGGGVTSAHLALVAASSGASSVTFIQRSLIKERQFDIGSLWMGPARGKLQEEFRCLSPERRMKMIRDARGGGSIPPEVVQLLYKKAACTERTKGGQEFVMKECIEADDVQLLTDGSLKAFLADGTCWQGDMIWLATGYVNQIENHALLHKLSLLLPIQTESGLPVLNSDLSWGTEDSEAEHVPWKAVARNRCWVMGAMASLELGPDALNLMGARQGAVRVARAIRSDIIGGMVDNQDVVSAMSNNSKEER
eukprot:scaffold227_cov165-Amphora_coffeaeformis.AAC.19